MSRKAEVENSSDALKKARRALAILEEQAAGFGKLHIPANLQIELEEKRREVAELEAQGPEFSTNNDNINTDLHTNSSQQKGTTQINVVITGDGNVIGDRSTSQVTKIPAPPSSEPQNQDREAPAWFGNIGLSKNPFEHLTAEEDGDDLLRYRIQPQALRPLERQIRGDETISRWIVFGDEGFGKTALRMRIAQSHYPLKTQDKVLCIVYDAEALNNVLAYANHSLETLKPTHYVDVAYELVRDVLEDAKAFKKSPASDVSARQALNTITQAVLHQGFRYLLCLVDQVDAVEIVEIETHPEKILLFLKPLMRLDQLALSGLAFRYFLPSDLAPLMYAQQKTLHLGRYQIFPLEWTEEDLERLITQRLSTFSKSILNPYTSLGQLCEPGANFDAPIDQALVRLAEGSPRAVVWLANRLIQVHCQAENPPRFIQPATWQQVKVDWRRYGRDQLFGSPAQSEGFGLAGDRIYFQGKEVVLSEKYDALLQCLIRSGDKVCTKEELIQAGWPGERPEGVTEAALAEAVRRMKVELKRMGYDSGWVKTVRGRGYRLQKPQEHSKG
ncbi:MAG TPA: winged helix-turn-helix domain-containing protein [Anaerolineae bacterium]|nr:winged helix-turn-helix domain-containing protein [Anaerolineae bacterium]HQH38659.1 winged helix-turn-helix domain-containing protein [Anaerolineae bacterium]